MILLALYGKGKREGVGCGRFFPLRRTYPLQQQTCVQFTFRYLPFYGSNGIAVTFFLFYALGDIVICFLDTELSLLKCLSVIEGKTEGTRYRD